MSDSQARAIFNAIEQLNCVCASIVHKKDPNALHVRKNLTKAILSAFLALEMPSPKPCPLCGSVGETIENDA